MHCASHPYIHPHSFIFALVYTFAAASADFSGSTDYSSISSSIPACESMECLHIPIIDDMTAELQKVFEVVLQEQDGLDSRITFVNTTKEVVVVDNDGKYG